MLWLEKFLNRRNLFTRPFSWIFRKIQFFENCRHEFHFCRREIDYTTFVSAFFCRHEIIWVRKTASCSTQGNFIKRFYKTNKYGRHSIAVCAIGSWKKIQKQLKNSLRKDLSTLPHPHPPPPKKNKLKQLLVIFFLNHIKNLTDLAKIYMTLLIPKKIQSNYFNC